MAKQETARVRVDVVKVPRARLAEFWPLPFEEVWDAADREGFEKWPTTEECQCAVDFALLRRGDGGKTYLLATSVGDLRVFKSLGKGHVGSVTRHLNLFLFRSFSYDL